MRILDASDGCDDVPSRFRIWQDIQTTQSHYTSLPCVTEVRYPAGCQALRFLVWQNIQLSRISCPQVGRSVDDSLAVISRHGFEQCQARVRVAPAGPERSWLPWHGFGQDRQFRLFHERVEEMFKSQSIKLHVRASSESCYTAALLAILRPLGRPHAFM